MIQMTDVTFVQNMEGLMYCKINESTGRYVMHGIEHVHIEEDKVKLTVKMWTQVQKRRNV